MAETEQLVTAELPASPEIAAEEAPAAAEPTAEEAAAKPRKKGGFGAGLAIYAWILLVLGGVALVYFFRYLGVYESSDPKHCIKGYLLSVQQEVPDAAVQALAELDPEIRSPEENAALVKPLLEGATLVRDSSDTSEGRKVYKIRADDGNIIGRVAFAVVDQTPFDLPFGLVSYLPAWGVVEEQYDFSAYYKMVMVVVPSDYSVYLGEKLLGPEFITQTGIPYAKLEECYLHYENLPVQVRYDGGPFISKAELRILDEKGIELSLEELTEERFLDRCTPEDRARIEEFVDVFLPVYVRYSSDIFGSAYKYYLELLPMMQPDSQFDVQMRLALQSFGWSNTKEAVILSIEIHNITDLGEGRHLVDLSYETEITALGPPTVRRDDIQLILVDTESGLLVDALYLYDSETYND